jgi:hypothetical protein
VFYRTPTPEAVRGWREQTRRDRLEGIQIHHPLEAAFEELGQQPRTARKPSLPAGQQGGADPVSATAERGVHQSFSRIRNEEPGKHADTFTKLVPRDRLLLCLISLRGGIMIEVVRALGRLDEVYEKANRPVYNPKK